ncbi:MAG: hypothetical protein II404_03325 [Prevotella sp.]|nr:hypothetical protein [Prevotella sp.]
MINFRPKIQNSWGKGFLTSLMGTTISILLTFGTSALVESKQKADTQRQTAMMVIHDIDVCIDQMEEMAKDEEKMNNAMQYVLAHQDQIVSLSEDTIALAMRMLTDYDPNHSIFDDAKENIFKSSQDIWSNLDNMAFIDNMENFYDQRREIKGHMAKNPLFIHPISYDDYYEMTINSNGYILDEAAVLKEKLKDSRVKFYIDVSSARTRLYRIFAQSWKDISDRNKFIMNISDEELAEYIKNSQLSGSPISKHELMGQWEREVNGNEHYYYEFLEEDSFCIKNVTLYPNPVYNNDIIVTYIYGGKWSLKNDTLFMICAPRSAEVKLDTSRITYRPEMRDSVRSIIRKVDIAAWKESLRKSLERDRRDTFPVTTNQARDKIEMIESRDKDGNVKSRYLKRVKDK